MPDATPGDLREASSAKSAADEEGVSAGTPSAPSVTAAFERYRQDPHYGFLCELRRWRAAQLRQLLANPAAISLDDFTHEVWLPQWRVALRGEALTSDRFDKMSRDPQGIVDLESALDRDELEYHGNAIWGTATRVFGAPLKGTEDEKLEYVRSALRIVNDPSLTPIAKAQGIMGTSGFGDNSATGLVMVFHPEEFALYNQQSRGALDKLGLPAANLAEFQESVARLKQQVGARDYLELDQFLEQVNRGVILITLARRRWWVNQRASYAQERDGGYLWAGQRTEHGRLLAHHANVGRLSVGDRVYHNAGGSLRAIGTVTEAPTMAPRPPGNIMGRPEDAGYLVEVAYQELPAPIPLEDIPMAWRTTDAGPFTEQGTVKQGYLFPVSATFAEQLERLLEERGQEHVRVWLFQANPGLFDLAKSLSTMHVGDTDTWSVSRYGSDMQAGDTVLLWQGGEHAGIYATGELIGEPEARAGGDQGLPPDHPLNAKPVAPYRITSILPAPLSKKHLLGDPVLSTLQVIRSPQGTNFKVSPEQWQALEPLLLENVAVYEEPPYEAIRQSIERQGLRIEDAVLQRYHLSLKIRGFVMLSGISGTGKTWLTQAYARATGAEYCLVAVGPNWNTNEDLLGYYNPLDQYYIDTRFSRFLRQSEVAYAEAVAAGQPPRPYHLALDEMNLARVEHYFARFLSGLEERAREGTARIDLGPADSVLLCPNLYIIGTVNVDETTHGFADKVYDRAQLIELDITREDLEAHVGDVPYHDDVLAVWDAVHAVAPFAFRVVDDIRTYIDLAKDLGIGWEGALDQQILQKVLPKMKGADLRVGEALDNLARLAAARFPLTYRKATAMSIAFKQYGFASYF